jgi:hypothetical protein
MLNANGTHLFVNSERTVSGISETGTTLPLSNERPVSGLCENGTCDPSSNARTKSGLTDIGKYLLENSERTVEGIALHTCSESLAADRTERAIPELAGHEAGQLSSGSCSPQLLLPTTLLEAEQLGPASPNGSDITTTGDNDFLNSSLTPMDWLPR